MALQAQDGSATAVGRFLRDQRGRRRWTLQRVSDLLAERGRRIPVSTLARIERGELDPGVRRLFPLLRLYDIPSNLVADLLEIEERSGPEPEPDADLRDLYARGRSAWLSGDVATSLACFAAIRERAPDDAEGRLLRQKAVLSTSIAALNLGKTRLAARLGEELLCDDPHPTILVNVLIHAAAMWTRRRGHEVAMGLLDRAALHLGPGDERAQWVEHQRAIALDAIGRDEEADAALERARERARTAGDLYSDTLMLLTRVKMLRNRGRIDEAIWPTREALRNAREHGFEVLQALAHARLGSLLASTGDTDGGRRELNRALALAVTTGDRYAEFLAHHGLWKIAAQVGDAERARLELESCRYFLRFVDDTSPEAEEIRGLPDVDGEP